MEILIFKREITNNKSINNFNYLFKRLKNSFIKNIKQSNSKFSKNYMKNIKFKKI